MHTCRYACLSHAVTLGIQGSCRIGNLDEVIPESVGPRALVSCCPTEPHLYSRKRAVDISSQRGRVQPRPITVSLESLLLQQWNSVSFAVRDASLRALPNFTMCYLFILVHALPTQIPASPCHFSRNASRSQSSSSMIASSFVAPGPFLLGLSSKSSGASLLTTTGLSTTMFSPAVFSPSVGFSAATGFSTAAF